MCLKTSHSGSKSIVFETLATAHRQRRLNVANRGQGGQLFQRGALAALVAAPRESPEERRWCSP
jgi:hypothetical protein